MGKPRERINMTKNMTRKSLALGAAAALVVTGFSAMPANAAGLADTSFVSLAPTTGTEYGVIAAAGNTFSMTANEAATVSTGNLKFLVTDPSGLVETTAATTGRTITLGADAGGTSVATSGTKLVTVTLANDLQIGDRINLSANLVDTTDQTVYAAAADGPFSVLSASSTVFTFQGGANSIASASAEAVQNQVVFEVIREARHATNDTYVVDSGVSSAATNEVLVLAADGATSRSVTVQAWMDANGNDTVDTTEYASPARTVTWTKPSELVTGVSMSPVSGDSKLTATVTTAPVLNGEQVIATDGDWLNVGFTRQDDTTVLYADDTTPVSVWSDTAKTFTVHVDTDADGTNDGSSSVDGNTDAGWAVLAGGIDQAGGTDNTDEIESIVVVGGLGGQVTVTTATAHFYRVGDKLNVTVNGATEDAKAASADEDGVVVTSVPSTTSFTYNVLATTTAVAGTATSAVADLNAGTQVALVTYGAGVGVTDRVFAGTYTAQVYVAGAASGSKLSVGTIAAATASASLATTGSASVTGNTVTTDTANDQTIKVGTATVPLTLTALSSAGVALGAGRTVVVTTETPVDGGATSGTFLVNGTASATLTTDANGQVTFNVTTNDTTATAQTRVSALVENAVTVGMDLHWDAQAYTLVDYGTTAGTIATNAAIARTILPGGSYSLNLAVEDQWFQAAAADTYRVVVSGSGVTEAIQTLVAGKAVVAVRDAGLTAVNGNFTSSVVLQKLTGGVWGATSTHTVTTTLKAAPTVNLGADGSTTYAPGGNVSDLSDLVAAKALVEIDQRSSTTVTPAYANAVTVQGNTVDGVTSAAVANVYVTISGPSNILFSNDKLAARGSLTLLSDGNGEFEVNLYSTSAQTDTVITVTAMGVSKTTKVSFTGVGVGEGTSLVITAPAAVKPATTFQVSAKLTDAYGNAVDTAAGRVKVTYTGSGIVWGTLPTETDSTGSLSFAVLLGSNDSASAVVTVSYDQNGDGDYVDAKDLTTTSTTEINAAGVASSGATVVNVGSFNGKLVVYAKNAAGAKISYKIAGKWVVQNPTSNTLQRYDRVVAAKGVTVKVDIYVDGVKKLSKSVVTK
jgi:trimeric autotransporter adhesin